MELVACTGEAYASDNGVLSRCPNFAARWQEISRRFHDAAKGDVWLDTTQAACVDWRRRHPEIEEVS